MKINRKTCQFTRQIARRFAQRAVQQTTAWIACLAILMTAVAPTISQAIAFSNGTDSIWSDICSTDGAKLARNDGLKNQGNPGQQHAGFNHCPYCSIQANSPALPANPVVTIPRIRTTVSHATNYHDTFPATTSWLTSQPRAPPRYS